MRPGGGLLLFGELRVRGGCRVYHQAAHIADVGHMAVKLKGFHELLPSLTAARDDERRDRPVAAPACQLGGSLVRGAGFQPGVENLFHFAAPF